MSMMNCFVTKELMKHLLLSLFDEALAASNTKLTFFPLHLAFKESEQHLFHLKSQMG